MSNRPLPVFDVDVPGPFYANLVHHISSHSLERQFLGHHHEGRKAARQSVTLKTSRLIEMPYMTETNNRNLCSRHQNCWEQ
jgi:hypothetical protein